MSHPLQQGGLPDELPGQNSALQPIQSLNDQDQNEGFADTIRLPQTYFLSRIAALGLSTEQAAHYGLSYDNQGNILQLVRSYNGETRTYIPNHLRKRYEKLQNRKSTYHFHESQFFHNLAVKRLHPATLAANPQLPKYLNQAGQTVYPLPSPSAISAFQTDQVGGTIAFIEGYFKAIALDLGGLESVAFTGITLYRLDPATKTYLSQRRPERVLIMYDADALDISNGPLTSRRPEDFFNSADKFSAQLFQLFRQIDLECEVHFVMGKTGSEHKGVDDLIETHGTNAVLQDLLATNPNHRRAKSQFFYSFRLSASTRSAKLRKLFLGKNYREWAEKIADAAPERLTKGFTYCRAKYQLTGNGNLIDPTRSYRLNSNPFKVDIPSEQLTVARYLDEKRHDITNYLQAHQRIAIQAPTGSGKTTFFLQKAIRDQAFVVLAVPTVNLARQIAKRHRAYALFGNYDLKKVRVALNSLIVVCTYDTLHHINDLYRRTIIFDEAHNLVNQFGEAYRNYQPFRAVTLRRCVNLFNDAKSIVLLSGTMPRLLCQALNCFYLEIHRSQNPVVQVYDIEATSTTPQSLEKCLLDRLFSLNFTTGGINIVFWNDTLQIENVKEALITSNLLLSSEIAVISRRHYNNGHEESLDEIVSHQRINPAVRLLLCTCLISEGVNINNKNIERIFTVGLRCPDTFRQFIARFRKLTTLSVHSILERETDLRREFHFPAQLELLERTEIASLQAKHIQARAKYYISDFAEEDLANIEAMLEVQQQYGYRPQLLNLIYQDGKNWFPDQLRILAGIRGRMLQTANNCFFYTQLHAAGFQVSRCCQNPIDENIQQLVDDDHANQKTKSQEFKAILLQELENNPELPINGLYRWYNLRNNRHGQIRLRRLVPKLYDGQQGISATTWLTTNRSQLDKKVKELILRYATLHFIGVKDKLEYLQMPKSAFKSELRSMIFYFEAKLFATSTGRQLLRPEHKEEIRIKLRIAQKLSRHTGEEITPWAIKKLLEPLTSVLVSHPSLTETPSKDSANALEQKRLRNLLNLTPARAVNLACELLTSKVNGSGRNRTVIIGQISHEMVIPPLALCATNLKNEALLITKIRSG